MLATRCKACFQPPLIELGRSLFLRHQVKILDHSQEHVEALVTAGKEEMPVLIEKTAAGLSTDCDCDNALESLNCQHVYAVLLAMDSLGMSGFMPGSGPLEIFDLEDDDGDNGWSAHQADDDSEEDEEASLYEIFDLGRSAGHLHAAPQRGADISSRSGGPVRLPPPRQASFPWQQPLEWLASDMQQELGLKRTRPPTQQEAWFALNVDASVQSENLILEIYSRKPLASGRPGKFRAVSRHNLQVGQFPDLDDREALALLLNCPSHYSQYSPGVYCHRLSAEWAPVLLPRLCTRGRLLLRDGVSMSAACPALAWSTEAPYHLELEVTAKGDSCRPSGLLCRGEDPPLPLNEAMALAGGFVLVGSELAMWRQTAPALWLKTLRNLEPHPVSRASFVTLLEYLARIPDLPPLRLPAAWGWKEVVSPPQFHLALHKPRSAKRSLEGDVSFEYAGRLLGSRDTLGGIVDEERKEFVLRDRAAERAALARLQACGFRLLRGGPGQPAVELPARKLMDIALQLTAEGWTVAAEGFRIRQPGAFNINVTSGLDWFDLTANVDYGEFSVSLPQLLAALKRGQDYVELSDGSRGMLPEEWLRRCGALVDLGTAEGEALRFRPAQAALLDALLAAQPGVDLDQAFQDWRHKLQSFSGVTPREQPAGFTGQLRGYQNEGLGWLHFLDEFGFGGCLADDMGLGKTIQVLALLEERRQQAAATRRPSLVVAPRSLIHNWMEEAARFVPQLRVLNYTGLGRGEARQRFEQFDLIITTYGTLRRDIVLLGETQFDFAILDEAQAIKNSASQSAKSCRLLQARRRLAMSGTPVENHLGELWSLFEFLNPGMLGRSSAMKHFSNGQDGEGGGVALLARALRPFVLRRTKGQVLHELPEKTEQTLYCELQGKQRKQYDELRDHYRAALNKKIKEVGLKRAKIHVLEALLRLRQAACHPGLLDKKQAGQPSAKLETLLEQVREVASEGHKALVFSQFTSLLAIVRRQLDLEGVTYEYLDGKTRDRKARVDRFQTDAKCPLFLISLKAGGLGLNLTAADYVFILDPWWNPAVEAQAVDRAHRIGQTRPVFAYRLIAKDTVEEKILELQRTKRDLADAIISEENSLIGQLSAEDLGLLLS